jgi:hypothetical protein
VKIFVINYLCAKIYFSEVLLFADDLRVKTFHVIKASKDCKLLQSDINSVKKWCIENYMKINVFKTNIIPFTGATKSIPFNYFLGDVLILRTDSVKYLGVMLNSKLHFHLHVDSLHSLTLKLLRLICFIIYNLSFFFFWIV